MLVTHKSMKIINNSEILVDEIVDNRWKTCDCLSKKHAASGTSLSNNELSRSRTPTLSVQTLLGTQKPRQLQSRRLHNSSPNRSEGYVTKWRKLRRHPTSAFAVGTNLMRVEPSDLFVLSGPLLAAKQKWPCRGLMPLL